jgi:hypothetical protein
MPLCCVEVAPDGNPYAFFLDREKTAADHAFLLF